MTQEEKHERRKAQQRAYNKLHYARNREKHKLRSLNYRKANPDKYAEYNKTYYRKYKNQEIARNNEYRKHRKQKDPAFKLLCNMRSAISDNLNKKRDGSLRHLGFTLEQLRANLESKFKEGMTWGNYGQWHVDHIIPVMYKNEDGSYYWDQPKLGDPNSDTFKLVWSLDNLQPLWESENCSKQNKFIG